MRVLLNLLFSKVWNPLPLNFPTLLLIKLRSPFKVQLKSQLNWEASAISPISSSLVLVVSSVTSHMVLCYLLSFHFSQLLTPHLTCGK